MGEVKIKLKSGKEYSIEKEDYYGFHTRPMSWSDVKEKFRKLTEDVIGKELQKQIIDAVIRLDKISVTDLAELINIAGKKPSNKNSLTRVA